MRHIIVSILVCLFLAACDAAPEQKASSVAIAQPVVTAVSTAVTQRLPQSPCAMAMMGTPSPTIEQSGEVGCDGYLFTKQIGDSFSIGVNESSLGTYVISEFDNESLVMVDSDGKKFTYRLYDPVVVHGMVVAYVVVLIKDQGVVLYAPDNGYGLSVSVSSLQHSEDLQNFLKTETKGFVFASPVGDCQIVMPLKNGSEGKLVWLGMKRGVFFAVADSTGYAEPMGIVLGGRPKSAEMLLFWFGTGKRPVCTYT